MDEELWDILSEPFTDELGNRNVWQKSRKVKDEEYFKIKQLFQKYTAQAVKETELKARISELQGQPGTTNGNGWGPDYELYREVRLADLKQELNGGKG